MRHPQLTAASSLLIGPLDTTEASPPSQDTVAWDTHTHSVQGSRPRHRDILSSTAPTEIHAHLYSHTCTHSLHAPHTRVYTLQPQMHTCRQHTQTSGPAASGILSTETNRDSGFERPLVDPVALLIHCIAIGSFQPCRLDLNQVSTVSLAHAFPPPPPPRHSAQGHRSQTSPSVLPCPV